MIRPITQNDSDAVSALVLAAGLFPASEIAIIEGLLHDYFGGNHDNGHRCVIVEAPEPLAVAYYEPAPATDRTWYLTMIGVRQVSQGQGHGAALMQYIESALRADGQRLLLVETSGLPSFDRTRQFYAKCGYEEAARVRDYYEMGDDMVLFRKALNTM